VSAAPSQAAWALLALLSGCATARPPGVADRDDQMAGAQWGLLAVDLATGDTLLEHEAHRRFVPGSTMKLLTAVTALDRLGEDYRWRTEVWTGGAIDSTNGVLSGDIVLKATGDPALSARFWERSDRPLEVLANSLRDAGVIRVTGALVVDASRWDSATVRTTWMADDLPFEYAATGGAFVLEEGITHVEITGGQTAEQAAAVRWWPHGEDGFVRSQVTTTAGNATPVAASYLPESHALELTGSVPLGSVDTVTFATRDPVRQASAALHRAIANTGVEVEGGWRVAWAPGETFGDGCLTGAPRPCMNGRLLAAVDSPRLVEVLAGTLKPSQNWIAEQVVRTLGTSEGQTASWDLGTATVRAHVDTIVGVDPVDLKVVDGSGLSVHNLATPRSLVQLLRYAHARPWGSLYKAMLAQPGEEGSTLSERLLELRGRLFAKTGSLTNVGSLVGYVTDRYGREIVFAVIVNGANLPAAAVREGIDAVVLGLAGN
jgi:D-alanyl-D-alanine carboxypeptidase/D-alanyl-D-alanine-endopeptidase (penicillin-binding protein 4)